MNWLSRKKDYWQPSPGGCRAILASLGFLVLGFLTLMIMKSMMNVTQDIVLVAILLLAPVLIFLVLSGKVLEINAGVVSAKFNDIAQKPSFNANEVDTKQIEVLEVILIMEQSAEKLHKMLQEMILYKHIILTININGGQKYNYSIKPELPTLLKEVSKYPNFTFLALLGKRETLIGYLPARQALQTIVSQENMKDKSVTLVEALGYGLIRELLEYGLIQEKVNCKESNISALKKMTEQKMNLLIVVDDDGKIQGVVEREQVLSKLMLALTAQ